VLLAVKLLVHQPPLNVVQEHSNRVPAVHLCIDQSL
jgi:hypothetical protein